MKKSLIYFALAIILIISACGTGKETAKVSEEAMATESKKANDFFERVFNEEVDRSPEFQSYIGIKKDYDKWNDRSEANAAKELEITKQNLKFLNDNIDYEKLDEETRLSYDLYIYEAEKEIENWQWRHHNLPVNQMFGRHSDFPSFLINIHRISDEADAEAYISRLQDIDKAIDQELEGLKIREQKGIIPPKFTYPLVISDINNLLTGYPFDDTDKESTLYEDFKGKVEKLEISGERKTELLAAAETALVKDVQPGYLKLKNYLLQLEEKAPQQSGAYKYPEGLEFYNAALKNFTTTDLTAEEIHQIGLKEVERIHDEMREIMKKVGFQGSLQDFFNYLKEDKRFVYPNTPEGKEAYRKEAVAIIENMKGRLDELFLTKPKADIIVKAVEPYREKSAGGAFYQSPSLDGTRPGIYYINLYDMDNQPIYLMESLAYHEGIPGHHMQLAIAQELEDIPTFRKYAKNTAYVEGWALYSEMIPKEIGMYTDVYKDFGRLGYELFRAARLVVDTGIHAKGWTREQAIAYMNENTSNPPGDNEKEVERYIVWPGQATGYKIGMLKILELREKAKKSLGEDFDIREFHDQVITHGPLPLNMLEDVVDKWIEAKRS